MCFLAVILTGCGGSGGSDDSGGLEDESSEISELPPLPQPPVIPQILPPSEDDPDVVARNDIRDVDQLFVYNPNSPYAAILKDCALVEVVDDACTLETLPFITQASADFTVEDILDRLLVTHDWMGERFETLLRSAPSNMLPLFGSLTSIVIGSTVRPSFYWAGTGGIQLDPAYLWLSREEKANISIEADYRNEYGNDLQFWELTSLQNEQGSAINSYSLSDTRERTLKDIVVPVNRLLYHELAHAVDFLPNASVATLDTSLTPVDALTQNDQYFLSPQMYMDFPLYSQMLYDLGQVSFRGIAATEVQKGYTPRDVGLEMAMDGAVDYYAYATVREDLATLFTAVMMKNDYNIDYFKAFAQKPQDESDFSCSELIVGWGVKNRLADPLVSVRAKWAVESILGSNERIDELFANQLGEVVPMTAGVDWCTNRDGVAAIASAQKSGTDATEVSIEGMRQLNSERRFSTH